MMRTLGAVALAAAIFAPAIASAQSAADTRTDQIGDVRVNSVAAPTTRSIAPTRGLGGTDWRAILNDLRDARPVMPSIKPGGTGDSRG